MYKVDLHKGDWGAAKVGYWVPCLSWVGIICWIQSLTQENIVWTNRWLKSSRAIMTNLFNLLDFACWHFYSQVNGCVVKQWWLFPLGTINSVAMLEIVLANSYRCSSVSSPVLCAVCVIAHCILPTTTQSWSKCYGYLHLQMRSLSHREALKVLNACWIWSMEMVDQKKK